VYPEKIRDVPDFGSGRSSIQPFLTNLAKSGSVQLFDQIWPDLLHDVTAADESVTDEEMQSWTNTYLSPLLVIGMILLPGGNMRRLLLCHLLTLA